MLLLIIVDLFSRFCCINGGTFSLSYGVMSVGLDISAVIKVGRNLRFD